MLCLKVIWNYFFPIVFLLSFGNGTFLENSLEYILQDYKEGDDADPIRFSKKFEIDEPLLKLLIDFDAEIKGITNFEIHQANLTPDLKLNLKITIKDTAISGRYNANGTYYKIMPLRGHGDFLFELKDFYLFLDTFILPNNGSVQLQYFDMDYNFEDIVVSVSGLTGEQDVGNVFQYFIKDFVPGAMGQYREEIVKYVKKITMTKGNEILKTFNIRTAIDIMKLLFVY